MKKKTILAIGAHPDDLEFGCSGTVAKLIKEGEDVYYLILTDGSKGSGDPTISSEKLSEIRIAEQNEAAKILGVKEVFFLGLIDGELENTLDLQREIARIIRKIKADTIISMDPTFVYNEKFGFINHSDHRHGAMAVLDASYPAAGNPRFFPELLEENLPPHKVKEVLLMSFGKNNFLVDITDTLDLKLKALAAHKSQIHNVEDIQNTMKEFAKQTGKEKKLEYAEGFVKISIEQNS